MITTVELLLSPEQAANEKQLKEITAKKLGINALDISSFRKMHSSIDARHGRINFNLKVEIAVGETLANRYSFDFKEVKNSSSCVVIGAGPAGLFAALKLIERGIKPIIFERGKDISSRKRDIATLVRNEGLNPESNYCYGEGGAGTFSDGKLYTRSTKRGNVERILQLFHYHGANENILYEAHPHIGTDKLPAVIEAMRKTILDCGGEIYFNSKVTNLIIENDKIVKVVVNHNEAMPVEAVILATGHSARDIYYLLNQKNIQLEAKPFALGVRVEHPQHLIDSIQYHTKNERSTHLPAASYTLATQVEGRGVYSFCMCPGGFIVPASTDANEIVVNGMSSSQRNSPFANAGLVVEIQLSDLTDYQQYGVMAGLEFQKEFEQNAFKNGGGNQVAPAQRVVDFCVKRLSPRLPESSYIPGLISSPVHFWLPDFVSKRLQVAIKEFDKKIRGFYSNEALVVAIESRTSSPERIPRNPETFAHTQITNLYPCGEGSGYAGGIVSSAIDGENVAERVKV